MSEKSQSEFKVVAEPKITDLGTLRWKQKKYLQAARFFLLAAGEELVGDHAHDKNQSQQRFAYLCYQISVCYTYHYSTVVMPYSQQQAGLAKASMFSTAAVSLVPTHPTYNQLHNLLKTRGERYSERWLFYWRSITSQPHNSSAQDEEKKQRALTSARNAALDSAAGYLDMSDNIEREIELLEIKRKVSN